MPDNSQCYDVVKFGPSIKFVVTLFAIDFGIGALGLLWVLSTGGI